MQRIVVVFFGMVISAVGGELAVVSTLLQVLGSNFLSKPISF